MGVVKTAAGALLVSAWLLTHALFMVNTNTLLQKDKTGMRDAQQFIPIRLPSVFQLSWFQKLVRQLFICDRLEMPRGVCGENCLFYFSWIVSVLTMAEWAAFSMLFLQTVWKRLIHSVVSTLGLVCSVVAMYGCVRFCAFLMAPHLPEDMAVAMVHSLMVVDSALLQVWNSLRGGVALALWALNGILSSLVWPSFEDIKEDVSHHTHRSLLAEVLSKVQEVASHIPEAVHTEF